MVGIMTLQDAWPWWWSIFTTPLQISGGVPCAIPVLLRTAGMANNRENHTHVRADRSRISIAPLGNNHLRIHRVPTGNFIIIVSHKSLFSELIKKRFFMHSCLTFFPHGFTNFVTIHTNIAAFHKQARCNWSVHLPVVSKLAFCRRPSFFGKINRKSLVISWHAIYHFVYSMSCSVFFFFLNGTYHCS